METEDKTQEIAERAERLQEIGSSILRAAGMNCIWECGFWMWH